MGLRDVVDQILQPFGLNDRRATRFSVEGDDVHLHPNIALTLAMVFHELATNAAKYGRGHVPDAVLLQQMENSGNSKNATALR